VRKLSQYRTFAFYDHLATDRSSYTSLVSQHLRQSTRDELERHGYVFDDRNPNLKVNFNVGVIDRQEIDLVDNHLKSLVWQGVADGRVDDRMIEAPGKAIDTVVKQIFVGFPLSQKQVPGGGSVGSQVHPPSANSPLPPPGTAGTAGGPFITL